MEIIDHLNITSLMDIEDRVRYTEQILRNSDCTKFKYVVSRTTSLGFYLKSVLDYTLSILRQLSFGQLHSVRFLTQL